MDEILCTICGKEAGMNPVVYEDEVICDSCLSNMEKNFELMDIEEE